MKGPCHRSGCPAPRYAAGPFSGPWRSGGPLGNAFTALRRRPPRPLSISCDDSGHTEGSGELVTKDAAFLETPSLCFDPVGHRAPVGCLLESLAGQDSSLEIEIDSRMTFTADFKPPNKVPENALWFLFHEQRLLVKHEKDKELIPQSADLEAACLVPIGKQFLGSLDKRACYAAELPDGKPVPDAFSFVGLRDVFARFEEEVIQAAGLANQLVHWNRNHQYCGKCGNLTKKKTDERARICPKCGLINYPRLSPAIIVAVLKDHQILLAHSKRFPTQFYSVLAGFVEPGETLEKCVGREVFEEVGITVKNIRYFGSQPWPFPDSLMVAFTAEYAGGEIKVDHSEIVDADWFSANRLPRIPPKISIARQLIDWFSETMENEMKDVQGSD